MSSWRKNNMQMRSLHKPWKILKIQQLAEEPTHQQKKYPKKIKHQYFASAQNTPMEDNKYYFSDHSPNCVRRTPEKGLT